MRIEINEYIVADNEICHGKPIFKGTRIMVWQVLDLLQAGINIEEIRRDYYPQLTKEAILSAIGYASKLIEGDNYTSF